MIKSFYDQMEFVVEYHLTKVGMQARDESGAVSTETAVLTAGLVAIAAAGLAILLAKMSSNAAAIPNEVTPPGGGG